MENVLIVFYHPNPNSRYGFAGYNDNDVSSFEEMNVTEDDFVDIPADCFDYSFNTFNPLDSGSYFPASINMKKVRNKTNIKLNYVMGEKTYENTLKPFENNWRADDTLVSKDWSNGGTSCDCWGGTYNITPDNPLEFVEFDDILSKICPNISFLQYKQLYNKCTEIVTYSDRDYYGGCETYSYHKCDLKKLWEVMREMELF